MKRIAILFGFFLLMLFGFKKHSKSFCDASFSNGDSIVVLTLPRYKVDSCLVDLLSVIAKNHRDHHKKYYSLSFFIVKTNAILRIWPEHLNQLKYADYSGFFVLDDSRFFCRGDISKTAIFKPTGTKTTFRGVIAKRSKNGNVLFLVDPILQGTFNDCKGISINVEVYSTKPIKEVKIQKVPSFP